MKAMIPPAKPFNGITYDAVPAELADGIIAANSNMVETPVGCFQAPKPAFVAYMMGQAAN